MIGNFKINGTHIRTLGFNTLQDSQIKSPDPNIQQKTIEGTSDVYDATEAGGFITYGRGEIVTTIGGKFSKSKWPWKRTQVARMVNGQECRLIFDRDRGYYYTARGKMDTTLTASRVGKIKITWNADPYKWELTDGKEPQLWDDIDLNDGVFRHYEPMTVHDIAIVKIIARDAPVSLKFELLTDGDFTEDDAAMSFVYISHAKSADAKEWLDRTVLAHSQLVRNDDGSLRFSYRDVYTTDLPEFVLRGEEYVKIEGCCCIQLAYRGGVLY